MRSKIVYFILCYLLLIPSYLLGITLREELEKQHIECANISLANLDEKITSFEAIHDEQVFCIAYYLDKGGIYLDNQLYIALLEIATNTWEERILDLDIIRQYNRHVGGAIMGIQYTPQLLYLEGHYNPSATKLTVLNRETLEFYDAFLSLGNLRGRFRDETVVYQNHQVHFPPWPHPTQVSLYFPSTKEHRVIYPLKPYQNIRTSHIEQVRSEYERRGEPWFQYRNHNWNPEEFGDNLCYDSVAVNDETEALAFIVSFDNTSTWKPGWAVSREYLNDTRKILQRQGVESSISADLVARFYQEVRSIVRAEANVEDFLSLFNEEPEFQEMIQALMHIEISPAKPVKEQLIQRDARWGEPQTWQTFIETCVEFPSEPFTPVVYFYKDVKSREAIIYRELLLQDVKKTYGERPLREYLTHEGLAQIFSE